jgi:hypothetical protein
MARARNIKPELFMCDRLGSCSAIARLFFIGMLLSSDDHGTIKQPVSSLKQNIFPYRDICVDELLEELKSFGLIVFLDSIILIPQIAKYCTVHPNTDTSFHSSNRRAMKRMAIPSWANFKAIKDIYSKAKKLSSTGEIYHVDHIIPINSKLVCGLHVESNLQIIKASENLKKSNKFNGDSNA